MTRNSEYRLAGVDQDALSALERGGALAGAGYPCAERQAFDRAHSINMPVSAAAVFVGNIGTATRSSVGNSTVTITVGPSGVTPGNSIIVAFASSTLAGVVGCADSKNNAYHVDADRINGGTGGVSICSAHNVSGLAAGDQIVVFYPPFGGASSATANEFSGLGGGAALDQTSTAVGNSASPNSGATATTAQADELIYGAVVFSGSNAATFTPGVAFTRTNPDLTGRPLASEYDIVSTTGTYSANGTLSTSNQWAAAVATYIINASGGLACACFDDFTQNGTSVAITTGHGFLSPGVKFFISLTCDPAGVEVPANITSDTNATLNITGRITTNRHLIVTSSAGTFCSNGLLR